MKRWKLLLFASALCIAPVLAACGDDEGNNDNPDGGGDLTDSPVGNTDGPDPGDGGGNDGSDGSVNTSSFPKYVQSLIEVKTNATGVPDTEAVWGAIPDDDKYVYPAAFFP
jgi:hypothetical protein